MDEPTFVANFVTADPVLNITGSGGTNLDCLASYHPAMRWKCLLAPYVLPHVRADVFIMNSAYDAWQLANEADPPACVPNVTGSRARCDGLAAQAYGAALKARVKTALEAKKNGTGWSGCYIDSCYVHEQNVAYCFDQKDAQFPNCAGWTPESVGSMRYGYWTGIRSNQDASIRVTPRQAFSRFYFSQGASPDSILIDQEALPANPTCIYAIPR